MEIVEADVLVIGGGGAGLRAAIEARRGHAKVVMASKTPAGYGNCTTYSGAGCTAAVEGLSPEQHFEDTVTIGRYINNRELVEVMVREAPARLLELRDFGVKLLTRRGSCYCLGRAPIWGLEMTRPLTETVREVGVEVRESTMILELIERGERIGGAIGFDYHTGEFNAFSVKSVVLATGGAGAFYSRSDNPIHTTGDGYTLTYKIGLDLQDMEFVQFYPLGTAEPGLPTYLILPTYAEEGSILNSKGENIPEKYGITDRPIAVRARDLLSRAIVTEINEGLGVDDAVLLDLTKIGKERWDTYPLLSERDILTRTFKSLEKPIHISPVCHHFMGGVIINRRCETTVKGLYAAGEVVGGIHGANRKGGNALSDAFVFGARAGKFSSEYARTADVLPLDTKEVESRVRELADMVSYGEAPVDGLNPRDVREEINRLMWYKVGVIRSEEGLKEAIERLREMREEVIPRLSAEKPRQLVEAFEAMNGVEVAEMVARSALYRRESRGAHYRVDHPEPDDDEWLRNVIIKIRDEKPELTTRPVIESDFLAR